MISPIRNQTERTTPIWLKVAFPICFALLLFLVAIFVFYLPALRESLFTQRKQAVRDLTTVGEYVLAFYHTREKQGYMTRDEAQKMALAELEAFRYGPKKEDYYWVLNYEGVVLMHPFRKELVGKNNLNLKDNKGNFVFAEFINATRGSGKAFVEYYWQKASHEQNIENKLSFVIRFAPWGWIVGTGMYIDDVDTIVKRHVRGIIQVTLVIFVLIVGLALVSIVQGVIAGRRIRESEARLRGIYDQTFHFIGYLDLEGRVLSANKPALQFINANAEEVKGLAMWNTPWWEYADVRQQELRTAVAQAAKGESSRFEVVFDAPAETPRVFDVSIKPVRDEKGVVLNILAEGRDITKLKQVQQELERLNEQLEQRVHERTRQLEESLDTLQKAQGQLVEAEKMASLGGLVAGVAHEINTPLGLGVTSISFLEERVDLLEKAYASNSMKRSDLEKFFKTAREAVNSSMFNLRRAAQLIQSFKQVAVDQTSEALREFNVKQYLEEVLASLRPKYKRTGHRVTLTGDDDLRMRSYPGALTQVIANLLVNSLLHAFEGIDSGAIDISVRGDGEHIVIVFTDNGCGMTKEQRSKIFEPFFTTRRGQGGSGLGMHIVFNLVNQKLGGTIRCESSPGRGATFTIRIPGKLPPHGA